MKVTKDKANLNAAIKSKKKITKMVLLNGLLFIVAYTPEFLTSMLLIIFEKDLYDFCITYVSCNDLNDISEFFTFILISFQFFIYKNFNYNFDDKFAVLKRKFINFFRF